MDESHRFAEPHQQSKTLFKAPSTAGGHQQSNTLFKAPSTAGGLAITILCVPLGQPSKTTFWLIRALVGYMSHYKWLFLTSNSLSPQHTGRPPGGLVPGRKPWLCSY
jgi:hypothetical protein